MEPWLKLQNGIKWKAASDFAATPTEVKLWVWDVFMLAQTLKVAWQKPSPYRKLPALFLC